MIRACEGLKDSLKEIKDLDLSCEGVDSECLEVCLANFEVSRLSIKAEIKEYTALLKDLEEAQQRIKAEQERRNK